MTSAFSLDDVCVSYGEKIALSHISLEIACRGITTILGTNGSGKTTLLKALASFLPLQSGKMHVFGKDAHILTKKQKSRTISYLPQQRTVPDCTVEQLLLYGRFPHKSFFAPYSESDRAVVSSILNSADLAPLADRPLLSLSGGQRQKVYIAMALAQESRVLLLDEPLTFLDIKQQFEILQSLRRISRTDRAVVMVSHNLDFSLSFSDSIILLSHGSLVFAGNPAEAGNAIERTFAVRSHKIALNDGSSHYIFTPNPVFS